MDKSLAGRKQFDGKDAQITLQKLEQAFALGSSDREACVYGGISPSALYAYQKKNPQFLERKTQLKITPVLKARQELVKGLSGNPELALKYLERKMRDEFSLKTNHAHSGQMTISQILDQIEEAGR